VAKTTRAAAEAAGDHAGVEGDEDGGRVTEGRFDDDASDVGAAAGGDGVEEHGAGAGVGLGDAYAPDPLGEGEVDAGRLRQRREDGGVHLVDFFDGLQKDGTWNV
jgi:hypothetical protein